jgi:hypothetical protein
MSFRCFLQHNLGRQYLCELNYWRKKCVVLCDIEFGDLKLERPIFHNEKIFGENVEMKKIEKFYMCKILGSNF